MRPLRPTLALLALGALAFADPKAASEELPAPARAAPDARTAPDAGTAADARTAPDAGTAAPDAGAAAPDAGATAPDAGAALPPPPAAACKPGEAPLTVTLLVLLRHPTDKVPQLPEDGLSLLVDGVQQRSGVKVGEATVLCTTPGEHEVTAQGGSFLRSVKSSAPGIVRLPIAMATQGPTPGLPPGFGPKPPPH